MSTNFNLAPPAKTVDGLLAVPIDIQHLAATMAFDAATESCDVDATVDFVVGPTGGHPIFDLRQTIGAAWLDGTPIAPALLGHHDFGGGTDAGLRVVEAHLSAGSAHQLRVTYQLALPAALNSGSGPPTYAWSSGRLNLKFWYTDLRAGRYLDSWLPGNLLFDQFSAELELSIANTAIAHRLISNGARTDLGTNHWRLSFPDHFTVCSGMLRIQPLDEIESRVGTTTLPGGSSVAIHCFKGAGSSIDLATQETEIATRLAADVTAAGAYGHGSRFTVFFEGPGGMEYAGAARTSLSALAHEIFHSWWARGVQPASQNDAWWDEAWTVYVTGGYGPAPLSFARAPVELFSQNPWVRSTPGGSYSSGRDVFRGLAAILGDPTLKSLMRQFYEDRPQRPVTTLELESALLCGSGQASLVDVFHRFVYGFADPSPAPNLWLRDDPAHTGAEAWGGRFWDSPDLWVRHEDDGGTGHQSPVEGRDNWFYARVRNQGALARHFQVTFNVQQFAGTQFVYPGDFLPCIAATGGFDLAPNESRVVKAKWPAARVPPAGTHGCLLASALARADHPVGGRHVWQDNNLAQKNLTVIELEPDGWVVVPLMVGHLASRRRSVHLDLHRPRGFSRLSATILSPTSPRPEVDAGTRAEDAIAETAIAEDGLDCGGHQPGTGAAPLEIWTDRSQRVWAAELFAEAREERFPAGRCARQKVRSKLGFPAVVGLRLRLPANARPGERLLVDLVERGRSGRTVGGIAVEIRVVEARSTVGERLSRPDGEA